MACNHDTSSYDWFVEFLTYLETKCTRKAELCKRTFVVTSKSNEWLLKVCSSCKKSPLKRLLYTTHELGQHHNQPGLQHPIHAISQTALVVFSILIKIGHPKALGEFVSARIQDKQLPLEKAALLSKLRMEDDVSIDEKSEKKQLVDAFFSEQYRFCPHVFCWDADETIGPRDIVPITQSSVINDKGGTADLLQVEVLEDFVHERLRDVIPKSRYEVDDGFGFRYHFALKSFDASGENSLKRYNNEKAAFANLRNQKGLVKCLASFSQRGESHAAGDFPSSLKINPTHNLLLEYGICDLDVYFAEYHPPLLDVEIFAFWKELFEVAKAVEGMHNIKRSFDSQKFNGWHADIKPANILFIEGKFKLADPGYALFVRNDGNEPRGPVEGGTYGFAAPEHQPGHSHDQPQEIDIWSLGCVLSVAATWMTRGYGAVKDFEKVRCKAIESIRSHDSDLRLPRGDYFHNGQRVLDDIGQWHDILHRFLPSTSTGNITRRILKIVDKQMLREKPKDRISAKDLCKKLDAILEDSLCEDKVSRNIIDALQRSEYEIQFSPKSIELPSPVLQYPAHSSGTTQDRKDRKTQILAQGDKKTAQRSVALTPMAEVQTTSRDKASTAGLPTAKRKQTPLTINSSTDASAAPHPSRDVFQVRNEFERLKGKGLSPANILKKVLGPSHAKDKTLARYIDDIDIKFLIDNAHTMERHWDKTMFVLETLAMLGTSLDRNGMDLYFTRGGLALSRKTKASDFVAEMNKPQHQPMHGAQRDMNAAICDIFEQHVLDLEIQKKCWRRQKNLLLIILTDGIWEGMEGYWSVGASILDGDRKVRQILDLRPRPVGVEFVQLGRDPDATYRLRSLDDDIGSESERDIVDHEHSDGDVNKMFLGSLVKKYDDMPPDTISSPTEESSMSMKSFN